ncbi:ribonuclease III [Mycoplasmopsis verecunda]|uniref:Ribonuclease 3 n=1 Tax=Mycoplasmopsis verecunda TaxID=171291 RepID=A0A1T4KYD1_9BACT|nr:ribonuclease III [Mycoplasmopsis verecunda]WPB54349.1 ribonuclease III [Mycoplasmopsis verecunda]SJZ47452.1 ribonuclease-3 [Mycoplasmopsis verecunda]
MQFKKTTNLNDFLKEHNIEPKSLEPYILATTHPSYNRKEFDNYERLEFLGDAVLQFLSSIFMYKAYPNLTQGPLTRLRSQAVGTDYLSHISKEIGLVDILRTGPGKMRDAVTASPKVQADIFESMVGAIYIDQGLQKTADFVYRYIKEQIIKLHDGDNKDPKGILQEYFQSMSKESITYNTIQLTQVDENNPHPLFQAQAIHDNVIYGVGTGNSKKEAETNAALDALNKLKDDII